MDRKHLLYLTILLFCFFAIAGGVIARAVSESQHSFETGAPPIDIKNALIPQQVSLSKMHPPALRPADPMRYGNITSTASVVEFGDFECAACKTLNTTLAQVLPNYKGKVRLVWRDLPITTENADAMDAAVFARCAGLQGKFWPAHDMLYGYERLNELTYSSIQTALGLNTAQMDACRQDSAVRQAIQTDIDTARNDGINSAPFLFVGTTAHDTPITADELDKELKAFLSS